MVIGVDAGCLSVKDDGLKTGVYYAAYNTLLELGKIDKKNIYHLYSFIPLDTLFLSQLPLNFKNIVLPSTGWMKIILPAAFLVRKPDVFLALSQAMPLYHPGKTIGIVHGLDFYPQYHNYKNSLTKLEQQTQFLLKHAEVVMTTSHFLKKEISDRFGREDVIVQPLGVSSQFVPTGKKYKHQKPYLLFVGSLKPSKNIPIMLKGFAAFLKKTKKDFDFILVGSSQWPDVAIQETITAFHLTNRVHIIDAVENSLLPAFYRGAYAFVSVALYEGFGMTLVEAMSCGIPVITGNHSAETEIVGDAGILVSPQDINQIADAMELVSIQGSVHASLAKKNLAKARDYSWAGFAKNIHSIIESI